jgi:diguanylate cyclase (GGDEF)-like protein
MESSADEQRAVTLLYVEDDWVIRKLVVSVLRAKFPELVLHVAENGQVGLDLFTAHGPDVVLTDIRMPVKDGIQMAREIKALDRGTQIIVLTAASDTDSILEAIDIGINHYVIKPIVMGKLIASIRHCIDEILLRRHIRQQEAFIHHLAYYDSLTGLPNRLLFNELLHQSLAQAQRHSRILAVLYLDLDRFKTVNDTLGHPVGDQLLQAVAQRLKECCRREQDTVARRGGDEFIILLSDLDSSQDAVRVARKIIDAFALPLALPGHELFISPSIGVSLFPDDGDHGELLIRNADMAMYSAKEQGRNRYHLFNPSMNEQSSQRLALENSMRLALRREEFFLNYQPNVDVETGRVVSIEALVRWQHPELGLVAPQRFIPLAEETGLIVPLSEWVLRTACAQNRAWQDAGHAPMRVAVNISPRQFQTSGLVEMVERVLAETGLAPCWLELEVPEGVMLHDTDNTMLAMRRLSDLGVHITIDDFGTGFTSLSCIRKLPIDTIKIDRSFVSEITVNPDNAAIATAVITMAQSLGLSVIAEGVEGREQLRFLYSHNCPEMQGYFFSKPLLAEEFSLLLGKPHWQNLVQRGVVTRQGPSKLRVRR